MEGITKLGVISKTIEKETKGLIKSGDICINKYHLETHIPDRHYKEISQLGMDPLAYVKYIATNFTEIRYGAAKSFFLVSPHNNKEYKNVAAISMEYVDDGDYWEVCTAQPRSVKRLEKRDLIWPLPKKQSR